MPNLLSRLDKNKDKTQLKTQRVKIYYELSQANPFRQIKLEHKKPMDVKKIVVIVEDVDAARAALLWALHNLLRYGDVVTLLHVFPSMNSRNRKKLRLLRLKGYQLALSFKDICNDFFNTNVEIIVTEGDLEGARIAALVREIGASALVVGLHDRSFLYRLSMSHNDISSSFNCRVLAIKQPAASPQLRTQTSAATTPDRSSNLDFSLSQIEIDRLEVPDIPPPKIPYRICPNPSAIIWRSRKSRRKGSSRREAHL